MNDTLFVIDSAAADLLDLLLLPEGEDPFPIIDEILAAIRLQVEALYDCGARNFLIADLLPLGIAPGVKLFGDAELANLLAFGFNMELNVEISAMVNDLEYPGLKISTAGFFLRGLQLVNSPEEFGFTNIDGHCIKYGVIEDAYCDKPKEYLFWDMLHPTKAGHALLGLHALERLPVPD